MPDDQPILIPEGELEIHQFAGMDIRKILHDDEWYFCVVDIIGAVTESARASAYWTDLKTKLSKTEGFTELYDKIVKFPLPGKDGVNRPAEVASIETIFRIIQSIPSPKAEPVKRWLAKVGFERIQEFQNPEIAVKRAIFNWQLQGRDNAWIDARLKTIVSRKELTDEWKARGISEGVEYAVLTDEINRGTFNLTTKEHKDLKGLKNHNLRDHMSPTELVLTMLGETATTQIAKARDARGFKGNKDACISGGKIAGDARKNLEKELGMPVVSSQNFLKSTAPENPALNLPESYKEASKKLKKKS